MILNLTQRTPPVDPRPGETVLDLRGLRELARRSPLDLLRAIRREKGGRCIAVIPDHDAHQRNFFIKLLCLAAPARSRAIVDLAGRSVEVGLAEFARRDVPEFLVDGIGSLAVLATVGMRLLAFGRGRTDRRRLPVNSRAVLYLRSGLYVGYTAGGSVGHLTGVTSGLARLGYAVTVHSSERLPFLTDPRVGARVIPAGRPFRNFPEIRSMRYGEIFAADILAEARGRDAPRFVYQRQSLNDVSGALIAARLGVPLVIEYNGSEVWSSRYWGNSRLTFARVSSRLEDACFAQADLIVVVSQPLREELVARGVPAEKVLVNPNGVDPDRYSPTRFTPGETAATRAELGVPDGAVVVGFVGTFSPWHGVDVLAKAIPEAVRGGDVRFLLIGDGPLLAFLRRDVDAAGASASVVYTGLVPQHETPRLLACCDLFVSPQVDNPDGTRFFGSPTKLFEYMAFGRGIVASRAGQIGEILTDGESAVLVRPGDAGELAAGISRLARDPELRERLGLAARRRVLDRHTWDHHVARILAALEERCGAGPPTANAARR